MKLGTMQGRLVAPEDERIQSFPIVAWREEFPLAAELELACIEWIYERFGADTNPLASDAGVEEVANLSRAYGVQVESVCADILMDFPVVGANQDRRDGAKQLEWLMGRAAALGASRMILPFLGGNMARSAEVLERVEPLLREWVQKAAEHDLELHVETALPPPLQRRLVREIPGLRITWDIGNSLQFGYDHAQELEAFGTAIGSVHVKDALPLGSSVPLGEGGADFVWCFRRLNELGFEGPLVLQGARVPSEHPTETTRRYLELVTGWLSSAGEA